MPTFLSKVQYKHYEAGEFTDIKERTIDEIDELIRNYPWVSECHLSAVGLTAPSVTIQRGDGAFLKISHYYNSKFSIYWLTDTGISLKKIVLHLDDCIAIANQFCADTLNESDFQPNGVHNARQHFVDKEHIYTPHTGSALFLLIAFSIFPAIIFPVTIFGFLSIFWNRYGPTINIVFSCAFMVGCLFLYLGIKWWLLYYNHTTYSRGQFIDIKRGTDEFIFGTDEVNKTYKQSEIIGITLCENKEEYNPYPRLNVTEVVFSNGEKIKISGLIKGYGFPDANVRIQFKFNRYPKID